MSLLNSEMYNIKQCFPQGATSIQGYKQEISDNVDSMNIVYICRHNFS